MTPIDLRPERLEAPMGIPMSPSEGYPTVYLTGPKELADLPKEGSITFKYKRVEMSLRDRENGPPVSVTLKLKKILDTDEDPEESEEEENESEDAGEALDRAAKELMSDEEVD